MIVTHTMLRICKTGRGRKYLQGLIHLDKRSCARLGWKTQPITLILVRDGEVITPDVILRATEYASELKELEDKVADLKEAIYYDEKDQIFDGEALVKAPVKANGQIEKEI